jgi:hypothetical protein
MKNLFTSQDTDFWWNPEAAKPSDATQKSFGATGREGQDILKNPVLLALRCIDPSPPKIDRHEADRLRIANEVILQLELSSVVASNNPDGAAAQPFGERCSKEQVKRTRSELDAYLEQRAEEEKRGAHQGREAHRPRDPLLRNPILAALAESER